MPFNMCIFFSGKETKKIPHQSWSIVPATQRLSSTLQVISVCENGYTLLIKSTKNQYFELYSNSIPRHQQLSCHTKIVLNFTIDFCTVEIFQLCTKIGEWTLLIKSTKNQYFKLYSNSIPRHQQMSPNWNLGVMTSIFWIIDHTAK